MHYGRIRAERQLLLMRILFVAPFYEPAFVYGGPARSLPSLCRALVGAGAQVSVFTTDANGAERLDVATDRPVELGGVSVRYFRRLWGRHFFYSPGLARAIREQLANFDLLHCYAIWTYPSLVAASACSAGRVPRIESLRGALMPWCLHHNYWKKAPYLALIERSRLNRAAAIHCTDEIEKQSLEELGLKAPAFVVPNPVEWAEFQDLPRKGSLRSQLALPAGAPLSVFQGRLSRVKGVELALEAFAQVARQCPGAHFAIAGPDEDGTGQRARQQAARLGLGGCVSFLGMLNGEARLAALADADLFVLTSYSENFGMAAAEALAAGVPVLLSDRVGIAQCVAGAGAGVVVGLQPAQIAQAWMALLRNCAGLRAMGERGAWLVRTQFDAGSVARQMLDAYRGVLEDWRFAGEGSHRDTGFRGVGSQK